MGLIKATFDAIRGNLADQWLEVLEADNMSDNTVFCRGVQVHKNDRRFGNKKGTDGVISNGSKIHVYPNQFLILVDGGRIVDYTAEEGYYTVDDSSAPSLFNGQFGKSLLDAFSRIKYGGTPSYSQKAYFINLQEIKGIKFGTPSPVSYFDNFYNSELFLRAHGTYSIKITNPLLFYAEAVPKNTDRVEIQDINMQYQSEFLEAFSASLNQMSADNIRVSHVVSKSMELSRYMSGCLDEAWKSTRGMEIQAVGIASISYDDESKKLINMRNQGAMLGDAAVREGYVQGAIARGMEAAGSNSAGAAQAFMGMGVGMNAAGGFMAGASATNAEQMRYQREQQAQQAAAQAAAQAKSATAWKCECGAENDGKFCPQCGKPKPVAPDSWTCSCGKVCQGKFCSACGAKRPENEKWFCPECGAENDGKFCTRCGKPRG